MTREKLYLKSPILCEGKYDKIRLSSIIGSEIFISEGFGIFKNPEKRKMLCRIAEKKGLIVLTDSDSGGLVIRNYIRGVIPKSKIINLYIPKIEGREKRKEEPSKEGLLGVEGMECDTLYKLLLPFSQSAEERICSERKVTAADLYDDGLSGRENSSEKRKMLCKRAGLPDNISTKALIEAINLLFSFDEYKEML